MNSRPIPWLHCLLLFGLTGCGEGDSPVENPPGTLVPGQNFALEFFGTTADRVGRLDIARSTQIQTGITPNPLNFGGDFTIEFWIFATSANDLFAGFGCNGPGIGWISSNIVMDADRNSGNVDNDYGISIGNGSLQFGIADGSTSWTICGSTQVTDSQWHHVAFTRDASAGAMAIYVDGQLDVSTNQGPTGSVAFVQGTFGSPDDHLITFGVEHHDLVDRDFTGAIDELRFSNVVRYEGPTVQVPTAAFSPDANTVGLYHFDEGSGTVAANSATVAFDPFWNPDGILAVGGSPPGPAWITSTAPTGR